MQEGDRRQNYHKSFKRREGEMEEMVWWENNNSWLLLKYEAQYGER